MPFKIIVVHTSGESGTSSDTFVFHQERITVGRDATNDVTLGDYKRIVSKQHAEIVQRGGTFQVTDLGSKNFTYLNGDRLQPDRPYDMQPGDALRIGEFELTVEPADAVPEPVAAPVPDYDRTVFDASFVNPFNEGVALLAVALNDLGKHYDEMLPTRRDDALQEALQTALNTDGQDTLAQAARLLGGVGPQAPDAAPPAIQPPAPVMPEVAPPQRPAPAMSIGADTPRLHRLLDAALNALAGLLVVPWQFRHEFIGQTIMQIEERAFLYAGEAETIKRHILNPSISEAEAEERLGLLEEAAADVALHQVAMLDGYKAGVQEGAKRLIDQLNPDDTVEKVTKENALYRFLQPLAKAEALARLREQLKELRGEDWSAAERRTYRPPFIKAYLARMTSSRRR